MKVAPSILSVLNKDLDLIIKELEEANVKYLHLDVMDNIFVPNYTFDESLVAKIKEKTNIILDTHLMIHNPDQIIDKYIETKSDYLCFHIEASSNPLETIKKIKDANLKCGISIKPKTNVDTIKELLPYLDLVLVMSVEPGAGGQEFIEESENRINEIRELLNSYNIPAVINVDGGINSDTRKLCYNADIVTAGSYIVKSDNFQEKVSSLR